MMSADSPTGTRALVPRLPSEPAKTPVYVVLGMHRSGTSLCSNILSALGIDMADERGENRGNELGHWERWEIMRFQDEILACLDRVYFSSQHDFPFRPGWWAEPTIRTIATRLEQFVAEKIAAPSSFGFKDPRTCKLIPIWKRIFANLNLQPRFVICLRNPAEVAASLKARDGLDPSIGEFRCLDYIVDCFRYTADQPTIVIEYDEWFDNRTATLKRLQDFLALPVPQNQDDIELAVDHLVRSDLRHQRHGDAARQPLIRYGYHLAREAWKSPEGREKLQRFTSDFLAFKQLLDPFEVGLKRIQGECEALRQQAVSMQGVNEQVAVEAASARDALSQAEQSCHVLRAEVETVRYALHAQGAAEQILKAERDAAVSARIMAENGKRAAEVANALSQTQHRAVIDEMAQLRVKLTEAETQSRTINSTTLDGSTSKSWLRNLLGNRI